MRRNRDKITPKSASTTGDIKRDLSKDQLAAIGAVTLAFNEVELAIDEIVYSVIGVVDEMQLEISSRLTIDSKVEIIKNGISNLEFTDEDRNELSDALGENVFVKLKSIRNSIIHARVVNAAVAIGLMVEKKAKIREVLLNVPALEMLYAHLIALRDELIDARPLILAEIGLSLYPSDDPNKAPFEAKRPTWTAPFRTRRDARLSLPQLPEFPSESEVREAEARWSQARQAEQMGWMQQWEIPPQMRRNNTLLDTYYPWVPRPPTPLEEEKK